MQFFVFDHQKTREDNFAKQILDYFDLTKYFDLVAGATMDYSRAKKGQVIAYALESFGVTDRDECIMVGDRDQDVNGAREQGFDCIGVLYGYGGREELVTLECREKLAGVVIDRFGTEPLFIKTDFGFKFSMRVMVSPTFYSWVLSFGEDMRIVAPANVRSELVEILTRVKKNYE